MKNIILSLSYEFFEKRDSSVNTVRAKPYNKYGGHIGFLVIKWPKNNSNSMYTKFVKCHTGKVHHKFQVPGMFVDQMNVPTFCELSVSRFKLLKVCTYCIYR